jgi:hypothetical protein
MKRWIGLILLLVPFIASAASFWDGNAALQRGDSTFEAGLFAASNSFPENTQIVIVNATTGKSVTVTVTKRIDGQSDILVLLSPPAAAAIGISQGTLASVRVTVAEPKAVASASPKSDQNLSQDPDLNPGAAYPQTTSDQAATTAQAAATTPPADATQTAATTPDTTQTAATTPDTTQTAATTPDTTQTAATTPDTTQTADTTQAATTTTAAEPTPQVESLPTQPIPATTAAAAATPAVPANTPEAPQPEQPATTPSATTTAATNPATTTPTAAIVPAQTAAPGADDAAIAAAAATRSPQKQLFQPPREDPKFAYTKPAETPAQPATTQVAQQPAVETPPAITAVIGEPGVSPAPEQPADVALAEAAAPDESVAQEIVGGETPAPSPTPPPAAVALATPEVAPVEQPAAVTQAVQPTEPVQTEVTGPAAVPPAAVEPPKLALATPEAPAPQKPAEQQTGVAAKPADTRTPATTATTTPKTTTAATAATATPVKPPTTVRPKAAAAALPPSGKPGTFYVQLGAYATEKVARDLAATLASTYPAVVLNSTGVGTPTFRVVVGPLNKAESGTLLTWFKRKGFPDAFLRQE